MRAVRIAAVIAALVVAAWFAVGVRQATSTGDAQHLLGGRTTAAEQARTATLLDHAAVLNPDSGVDLLRARLDLAHGDRGTAVRRFEAVTRREPDNIEAWTQLAFATARTDRPAFRRAVAQVRRLSPAVPAP